ncbi:MAG: FtsX-like permease family protein [Firmicutes bacterium]|nr:FtsX-like permease family protein [Bacillota bacterium]
MLKVNNKGIVAEVAKITYRANWKRNLLTIFAILLTTFLISIVIAIGSSYWDAISQRQLRMEGMDYDISLTEPKKEQAELIRSMENVKWAGLSVKCAIAEKYQDLSLGKSRLYWVDDTCWNRQIIPALETWKGTYPQKEDELLLSEPLLKAMGIKNPKLGMKLPIGYFSLADEGGEDGDEEALVQKDFTLCGWYRDYSGRQQGYVSKAFFRTTGVKQTDLTQGSLKITLKSPFYTKEDIVSMQNAVKIGRQQIIEADYDTISTFLKMLVVLALMLIMIFVTGYLFIYNSLYISISKDIRYYGQLKTVGMTSRQLKGIIYRQTLTNSLIGIPLGIISSALVSGIIISGILSAMDPLSADAVSPAQLWVYLISGVFAFLTNLLSSKKPAKIAGDCSPVEAIRYTGVKAGRRAKKREQAGIGAMAFQNMFRDKKQAVIILMSFTIAIAVFLVINVVVRANNAEHLLNSIYSFDIEMVNETSIEENEHQIFTEKKLAQIREIPGVKDVRTVTAARAVIPYDEAFLGEYYRELYKSRYTPGNYEKDIKLYKHDPANDLFLSRLVGIETDGKEFELLSQEADGLNAADFEAGKTAVTVRGVMVDSDCHMKGKTAVFSLPQSPQPKKQHSLRIAAVTRHCPAVFSEGYTPELIVSQTFAEKLLGKTFTEVVRVTYDEAFSKETEKQVRAVFAGEKDVTYNSKLDRYDEMQHSQNQVMVLGGSLGVLIALLAVLNYLNMMAASIQNRSKEFAALESIGMTSRQVRKMLSLEGAGYGILSLVAAAVAGIPASYLVFESTNLYGGLSWSVPWGSNLLLFAIVILLCMAAPVLLYRRTQKASIIDRLRAQEG